MTSAIELKSPDGTNKVRLEHPGNVSKTINIANLKEESDIQNMINVRTGSAGAINNRNYIIDGRFDYWTNYTQTSSGYGSTTMWKNVNTGSTKTVSKESLSFSDLPFTESNIQWFCRTVVKSVSGVNNCVFMQQSTEDVRILSGKTAVISFYAKSDAARKIAVSIVQNFGTGGSSEINQSAGYVTLTTSWVRYTLTVNIPSIVSKTLGATYTSFFGVKFWFDAGTNFSGMSSNIGQQSGTFDITGIQLEEGSVVTPFDNGSDADSRVGRYYLDGQYYCYYPLSTNYISGCIDLQHTIRTYAPTVSIMANGVYNRINIRDDPATYSTTFSTDINTSGIQQKLIVTCTDAQHKTKIAFGYIVDARI